MFDFFTIILQMFAFLMFVFSVAVALSLIVVLIQRLLKVKSAQKRIEKIESYEREEKWYEICIFD